MVLSSFVIRASGGARNTVASRNYMVNLKPTYQGQRKLSQIVAAIAKAPCRIQ
jgi:hypothetical protein